MEENNNKQNYISLLEAARLCSYSEPYLRLRARQGKLKSIKLGKKWMTTAIWLDDYERRVCEWRDAGEQKKAVAAARAVLVSAPAAIAGVVAPIDAPIEQEDFKTEFCSNGQVSLPPFPSRRKLGSLGGQIFPLPEERPVKEDLSYGWFGALLSGAAIALLLFAVVDQSGVRIIESGFGAAGQASVTGSVLTRSEISAQLPEAPVLKDFSLEALVEQIARVLNSF